MMQSCAASLRVAVVLGTLLEREQCHFFREVTLLTLSSVSSPAGYPSRDNFSLQT